MAPPRILAFNMIETAFSLISQRSRRPWWLLLTLVLFFAGQTHVFRPRTDLSKALLAIAPLLGAALIAISRCEDYRYVCLGLEVCEIQKS